MSMKNKIGIDICVITRMKIDDEKFLARFLHQEELKKLNSFENEQHKMEFAAGRWAAKEAMYKADNFKDNFNSVLIISNGSKPEIVEPETLRDFEVSISHDGNFAIAVAVRNKED